MKICIWGHLNDDPAEGIRKITTCLINKLSEKNSVLPLDLNHLSSYYKILRYRPDIMHFVLSPTNAGLITTKLFSLFYHRAKTVISAPHPSGLTQTRYLPLLKPDVILYQSKKSENFFKSLGYKALFLPNGVDTDIFSPNLKNQKTLLRRKYRLREDAFIILHVASLKRQRNLEIMKKLTLFDKRHQILVIGRQEKNSDKKLLSELINVGCVVKTDYIPGIEEIYALSDCYLFPTIDEKACIETPLSVLEAMSCNLPIVTTRFGALPRLFNQGNGFFYVGEDEEIVSVLDVIKRGELEIRTREMVLPYAWSNISETLLGIYQDLLK